MIDTTEGTEVVFNKLNEALKNATISFKHFIDSYPEELRDSY